MEFLELRNRWIKLCAQLGLPWGVAWTEMEARYMEPWRAYHNLAHVKHCLIELDEFRGADSLCLECAIWFHDLIYDTHCPDNEERSADAAIAFLRGSGLESRVAGLIMATKHDSRAANQEEDLMCDIDLCILGGDPETYGVYSRAIRKEYDWVSEADYRTGRAQVLERFLSRASIYRLATSQDRLEEQARSNLQAEWFRLRRASTDH